MSWHQNCESYNCMWHCDTSPTWNISVNISVRTRFTLALSLTWDFVIGDQDVDLCVSCVILTMYCVILIIYCVILTVECTKIYWLYIIYTYIVLDWQCIVKYYCDILTIYCVWSLTRTGHTKGRAEGGGAGGEVQVGQDVAGEELRPALVLHLDETGAGVDHHRSWHLHGVCVCPCLWWDWGGLTPVFLRSWLTSHASQPAS